MPILAVIGIVLVILLIWFIVTHIVLILTVLGILFGAVVLLCIATVYVLRRVQRRSIGKTTRQFQHIVTSMKALEIEPDEGTRLQLNQIRSSLARAGEEFHGWSALRPFEVLMPRDYASTAKWAVKNIKRRYPILREPKNPRTKPTKNTRP